MSAGFIYRQLLSGPPKPTASFQGKIVIVTGANTGLREEATIWLVRLGAQRVIMARRNIDKGHAAKQRMQAATRCPDEALAVWHLDMNSHDSVKSFANRVTRELPRLDGGQMLALRRLTS